MARKRIELEIKIHPKLIESLKKHWFWGVIILTIFLRLPHLFEPFTYGDEGIYLTLGQALRKGLVLYRDIHDNKPPMLYIMAAIGNSFSTFRLMAFAWAFMTIIAFKRLAEVVFQAAEPTLPLKGKILFVIRRFFSRLTHSHGEEKRRNAVIISTLVFAILISIHTFEGNIANAENFFLLPIIFGFLAVLSPETKKSKPLEENPLFWLAAGLLFSFATLFKLPALFDLLALATFSLFWLKKENLKSSLTRLLFLGLGFIFPLLITVGHYALKGAFQQYLVAVLSQNIPYLASWTPGQAQMGGLPLGLLTRAALVGIIALFIYLNRKKLPLAFQLVVTWFAFSLFAALLSSRPYPHYLLQAMPAFSLGWGFLVLKKKNFKWLPLVLTVLIVFIMIGFRYYHYPNLEYYGNFYAFALRLKNQSDYFRYFGDHTPDIYRAATYICQHTRPEEKIFIWGNDPSIYALSHRLPVGRYTVSYHIIDFNGYQETLKALRASPPRYLILSTSESRSFPELFEFVFENYIPVKRFGRFHLFHRAFLARP